MYDKASSKVNQNLDNQHLYHDVIVTQTRPILCKLCDERDKG